VGIASTDETGHFALPRMVLDNNKTLLDKIIQFSDKEKIELVILGESKNFHSRPNLIQQNINKFKDKLEEKGMKVKFYPEIFTTVEARRLQGNTLSTDASAAALILKGYIDSMYNNNHDSES
jgi:RNase H-fold protein (predicted Holliday junction resolvase)